MDIKEKMNKLYQDELVPSAHNIDGWQGHYDRMIRFYDRTKIASTDSDKLDFTIVFFQHCWHLQYWILLLESTNKNEFKQLWLNNLPMKICKDVCNGTKHLELDDRKSLEYFAIFREYCPYDKKSEWIIYANNEKFKLNYIMDSCIKFWKDYIEKIYDSLN